MSSLMRTYATFTAHSKPTVGDLKMSAVTEDHLGWLNCDGRSLSVSEWRFLFNAIGYQFGGSGSTFNLPRTAGTVPGSVGQGTYPGNTTLRELGDFEGTETHTLIIEEMPSHRHGATDVSGNTDGDGNTTLAGGHTHTATDSGHTHSYVNQPFNQGVNTLTTQNDAANDSNANQTSGIGYADITVAPVSDHIHTMGRTGGGAEHQNMQPTLFMGSTFIYSGKPTYGTWPLTNPPPPYGYGGQPQIL